MYTTSDKRNYGRMSLQNELKMRRKLLMCKKIASDIRGHWAKIEELETQFMNCFDTSTYSTETNSGFNPVNELFGFTDVPLNDDKIDVDVMRNSFMTSLYREIMQYRDAFDVLNKNINDDLGLIRTMINKDNNEDYNDKNDYMNNKFNNTNYSVPDGINQHKCDSNSCSLNNETKKFNSLYSQKKEQVKKPTPEIVKQVCVDSRDTVKEEKYNAINRFIKSAVVDSDEDGENEIINDIQL
jgi:hypothetical protein